MLPTFRSRKDRLRPYMEKQLKDTLFVELPVDALTDEADLSFMKGVPLPIKKEDGKYCPDRMAGQYLTR